MRVIWNEHNNVRPPMVDSIGNLLWWVIPGALAGMPMPFVHPARRLNGGGALEAHDDELKVLHQAGIRAVVSLLNLASDAPVYETAGFKYLCLPVGDGCAPSLQQVRDCSHFINEQLTSRRPVAIHCEGGIGRTGTMLAAYFIMEGESASEAIRRIRTVEPAAIETPQQIIFLRALVAN